MFEVLCLGMRRGENFEFDGRGCGKRLDVEVQGATWGFARWAAGECLRGLRFT